MRWSNLLIDAEEARQLPGYREPAVVRTFEAPEAMDVRFYEVRAKSALNRVPERSRMPFRWTINPYRGCTHACSYCVGGDTRILMADGRTKALSDVRAGDEVYGTVRDRRYRRYVSTRVLAHWSTVKPAHRVTLEDGTEIIASGDHRFLSRRGWKHVSGTEQGRDRRPHLTVHDELVGTGGFVSSPDGSPDYRRGYLCGLIRGDGHIGSYAYERAGQRTRHMQSFRLALTDFEALRRARHYLDEVGLETSRRHFQAKAAAHRPLDAISTGARAKVDRIRELIEWPRRSSEAWRRGFLAGIFDAEGSCSRGILRIANTDQATIDWTAWCLRRFDFDIAIEDYPRSQGLTSIRVRGGLRERLRFFHLVDPAISRKRSLEGVAVRSVEKLRVASIEPLGIEMPLYDITTGSGDFIANGVISHNCFARPTHIYLDMDAGRDFEREIVVKVNAPEVLRVELSKPAWKREHVAIGTNTDPYQWVESRYRLMPEIWAALRDSETPCSVLTKSPLLLRDLELFEELAERVGFTANLSIPTIDEKAWRASEPHTPSPRARIEAVAALNRAGVPTGVLVAPLMPGINDDPRQVERILELCAEARATHIGGIALHLRGEVRGVFMEWLRSYRPDLVPRYQEIYRRGAYAPTAERERLASLLRKQKRGSAARGRLTPRLSAGESDRDSAPAAGSRVESTPRRPDRGAPATAPGQEALF